MTFKPKKNSVIAVDMDKTLCECEAFSDQDCFDAIPIQKTIDKVNELNCQGHFIIIWTARRDDLRWATEYWLKKYGVKYNILDTGHKIWAEYYVDDRNILLQDL